MKSPREHALGLLQKSANDLIAARATMATGLAEAQAAVATAEAVHSLATQIVQGAAA